MREYVLILFILAVANYAAEAAKLNYPRVLLPIFQEKAVNFTLEVIEKNCYKWTSSRQDLISIKPIYGGISNECSYRAIATVQTRERSRNTAIVFAEEISSGETLRCDVIVDVIDRLNVRTTTRQLYLEEAPETFELHAFDSQGNEFSTLEGVEFNWSISAPNQGNNIITPALRFLSFTDSPYHDVPDALESFETHGIKGYKVLLEGINTGTSKVTVSMPHPEYNNVGIIEVYISILANLIIEPSEVHIMQHDTINFRILQLKEGKLQEISLNNQYFFEVENTGVAKIKGSRATGLSIGRTMVMLRDRNVAEDTETGVDKPKGLSAQITVAEPEKLGISLLPHQSWLTVEGERHEIAFDLYTSDNQKITLGSWYNITAELDETLFMIIKKTKNGSRIYGETIGEGISEVYGSYKDLAVQAELQIYGKLLLHPTKIILPFDPNVVKTQKLQFRATGGDGNYVWHSAQPQLLQINSQGLATTVIRGNIGKLGPGSEINESGTLLSAHTHIRVALQKNQKITRQADVYFVPPASLEIKRYNFETALNDYVRLHVGINAFINNTYIPYTNCENLILDLEFSNQIFQVDNNANANEILAPGACQILHLRSTALGTSTLRVSYQFQGKILQDNVNLNVFEPLSILNPVEQDIVLPIGSSRNIIYANGPQRIYTLEAELTKTKNYNTKILTISELEGDAQNAIAAYTISCRGLGESTFIYYVYNALTLKNFVAYKSEIKTTVHCVRPRFLKLYATQQLRSSCPREIRSSLLHLKGDKSKFEIEIEVQDVLNRRLMNISSLVIDWEFAAGDEHYHSGSIPHSVDSEVEYLHGIGLPVRDVLVTTLKNVAPNFRIKGNVASYNDKLLAKQNIRAERPPFGIQNLKTGEIIKPVIDNEIRFMAVNSSLLPFNHFSIFMSKSRREYVPVAQGSGYYDYKLSEQGTLQVEYDAKRKSLVLTPIRLGHVRIELIDLCLTNEPAHLSVSVVGIGRLRCLAQDRVERTKSIEAVVRLSDTNDNPLRIDAKSLHIYELSTVVYDTDILSVDLGEQDNLGLGEIRYVITGNNVGETKIVFNSGEGDKQITSEPLIIQVFAPIRLYPRNSTLIIGSSIQIYYQAGPHPNLNIVYHVHNSKVATMESAIVTANKLGSTQITGNCIVKNPISGKEEIISSDTVEIRVVSLKSIQIRTPLTRISTGAVMPVTIWGQPNLSPMILGTLDNMHVHWSTNQTDVLEIFNVFSVAGIEYGATDMVSVRVRALNSGKANIRAEVRLSDGLILLANVEVVVFKTLELAAPKQITMNWILAAPRSSVQLKCNLDDVLYKLDNDSHGIVSVTPDGLVSTKDTLGRDLIIAKTVEQTLPIGIEVKNVQYILVSLVSTIKLKQLESKIPRGVSFVVKVSLHDNIGNEFSHNIADVNGLKYELSTKDIVDVHIENNMTIVLNMPRETSNMIAISLKDTTGVKHAEDYIKLSVAESQHIYPTKTIFSVGDIICFDSPLTLSSIWTSSNEQIVSIDRYTGVARVHGNRFRLGEKIVVTNGDKMARSGFIKYDVEVRDADAINFLKSYDIFSGTEYDAYLVVINRMQPDKTVNLIAKNMSKCINQITKMPVELFKCRLYSKQLLGTQLLEHYEVTPVFVASTGNYACQLNLRTTFNEVVAIVKTNTVHLELEVTLFNGLTDMLTLNFVPGIKVSPSVLHAADLHNQELIVSGLDKTLQMVEVKPSNAKYLKVEVDTKAFGYIKYKITLLQGVPLNENINVTVESTETKQFIEIPIVANSDMVKKKCTNVPLGSSGIIFYKIAENIGLVISALLTLMLLIWVYITCFSPNSRTEINPHAFAESELNISNTSLASPRRVRRQNMEKTLTTPQHTESYSASELTQPRVRLTPQNESYVYGNPTLTSPGRGSYRRAF